MAESFVKGVELAVMRVTDEHSDADLEVQRPRELGAGFYEIGVMIDGAFVSLIELKAGDVDARIAAFKKAHPKASSKAADDDDDEQSSGSGSSSSSRSSRGSRSSG